MPPRLFVSAEAVGVDDGLGEGLRGLLLTPPDSGGCGPCPRDGLSRRARPFTAAAGATDRAVDLAFPVGPCASVRFPLAVRIGHLTRIAPVKKALSAPLIGHMT